MSDILLENCRTPAVGRVAVRVREGRIVEVGAGVEATPGERVLDAGGRRLIPGLIDVHIHGAGGADVLDGSEAALRTVSQALARLGVTGFLGTSFVRPGGNEHLVAAGEAVGRDLGGARLLGLHLEGPFLNPARRGGIPAENLYPPAPGALEEILELTRGGLRMMTIAPEVPGALELVAELGARGVVASFGHSDATYAQARAGIAAGIRHATHLYNAMRGLHHREPGPLVALQEAGASVQLIADDVHVSAPVVAFTRRVFGDDRVVLITDGMRTVGLPDGRYRFGDKEYESRDGAARYLDGTLIGTSLSLLQVMRRYREYTGCSLAEAVRAASLNPARVLGLEGRLGEVAPGRDADLVLLDDDDSVRATLVGGRVVYRKE